MARLTPAVPRGVLPLLAGVVWSAVGAMLLSWAARWLAAAPPWSALSFGLAGATTAAFAWLALFRGIARGNVERLATLPRRACVFAFQPAKSYLVMLSMIALGVTLRHSTLPRTWLSIVYTAIGGALFLASLEYHRVVLAPSKGTVS